MAFCLPIASDAIALEELEQSDRSGGGVSRFGIGVRVHLCGPSHSLAIVSPNANVSASGFAVLGLPRAFELRVCRVERLAGRGSNVIPNASASGAQSTNTWIRDPEPPALSQTTRDLSCSICTLLDPLNYATKDSTI